MADVELQSKTPAPVPVEPTLEPEPTAAPAEGELPDELIQEPVMQALMSGSPPAVSGDIKALENSPFGKLVGKYAQVLNRAGMGFYRSQQGNIGAMFNQLYIQPEAIMEADQKGALQEIAPPISEVEKALAADPSKNPVLSASGPPTAPPVAPPSPAPAGGGGAAPSPSLSTARRRNTQLGSPTSGPSPGAGRVLNAILKPVV
jgi:hypothetical protein